jgi:hypothetical protein
LPLLLLACSEPSRSDAVDGGSTTGGSSGGPSTDGGRVRGQDAALEGSRFEPPWLPNLPLDSVPGVLVLFASTLKSGSNGLELYAAVRNDGAAPLCGAAMMLELYDHSEQLIGTASGGVHSGRLYHLPDSSTTISCVAPGQTAMAMATTFPEGLVLEELSSLGHRFPAFEIDGAEPTPSATVSDLEAYATEGGTAYRGTVANTADALIRDPSVVVFPINGVGRPLGVATSTGMVEIAPGGTWSFETSAVTERGVDHVAFATASSPPSP